MQVFLAVVGAVLPCLAITLIVRRWFAPLPWRIASLAVLLSATFIGPGLFTARIPVPVDEVARGYPYRGIVGEVHVGNSLTNDTVKQILPWMQLVREQLAAGDWPLWNRHQFSGYPLLANGQSAPFAPFFLVTLLVPLPKQLVAMALMKLFCSFIFCFLFLKDEGRSDGAALFGAALFTFSIFETVYLYYPLTSVTALLPLLLWSVRRVSRSGELRWMVLLSACTTAAVAGGHPESVVHLAIASVIMLAIDVVSGDRGPRHGKTWIRLGISIGVALCIAAPAWLPVAEQAIVSRRIDEIRASGGAASFPIASAWLVLNPNGFGHPARGPWNWLLNYSMVAPTYVGLLALALGVAGFGMRNRRMALLLAAVAILFLVSMNWTIVGHFVNSLPLLSICANDRIRIVSVFFLAAVAAEVLDTYVRSVVPLFITTAIALFAAAGWLFAKQLGVTLVTRDIAGILVLVLFLIGAAVLHCEGRRTSIPYLAFACVCIELFAFNTEFNAAVPERYYRVPAPIVNTLRRIAPAEPFRVVGFDWVLLPNSAAQYGLEDIRGSDPMELGKYRAFFKLIETPSSEDVKRIQDLEQPGISFLNVRYALTEPGFGGRPGWQQRYAGRDGELYESASALQRFFVPRRYETGFATMPRLRAIHDFAENVIVQDLPGATQSRRARVEDIRQNRTGTIFTMNVDTPEPCFVASSQPMTPGWEVRISGQRVRTHMVNEAFIGFLVPKGHSKVVVLYRPLMFRASIGIAASTLICLLLMAGVHEARRRAPVRAAPA